ncbi:MAG: hypothetical protein ACE5HP_07625 [Gemmatimonadota bacterium]
MTARKALLTGLLLALLPATLRAQDPAEVRVGITYQPGYLPALAIPPVKAGPGEDEVAALAHEVLRTDLEFSDRFEILELPDSVPLGSPVNYGLWNQLGAVWLVTADVSGTLDAPLLRVAMHDVVYGKLDNVQAFALPPFGDEEFRMALHRVSDAIVTWATGDPGIAATRIAFRRRFSDGTSEIFLVDSDGHNLRRLTTERARVYSPSLSPDGTRLLYQVMNPDGSTAVYERDFRTGRRTVVSARPGLNITPTYAPSGRRIALARTVGDHTELFEVGGGRITRTIGGDALNPSYSPDGRRVAFEGTALGQQQVYVQEVDGGRPLLISRFVQGERGSAASPDWSPRGDRIAYMAWVENAFQIVAVNPDGTDRRILTSRGGNEDPSWAPDGRHIVFASSQRTGRALVVLDTVTGRTRILLSGNVDSLPDWSSPILDGG